MLHPVNNDKSSQIGFVCLFIIFWGNKLNIEKSFLKYTKCIYGITIIRKGVLIEYVHALRMTFPYFHFNWVGFNNRGLPSSFQAPSVW
jgi:hypothetical protein